MSIPLRTFSQNYFFRGVDMSQENVIEKIRAICAAKNIPVSKLEEDLGFGNGYLNPKKVQDIKMGRLFAILDYLNISKAEFFGDNSIEAELDEKSRELLSMKYDSNFLALLDVYKKMTPKEIRQMKRFMKSMVEDDDKYAD